MNALYALAALIAWVALSFLIGVILGKIIKWGSE